MTTHPAIRHDAHEPCPFCGCGLVAAPAVAPVRRRTTARKRRASGPYDRSADPFGTLPADWAYPESGTRELTAAERAASAQIEAYIAEHRGQVAIVDERTNTVTGWRDAA
jgi:hypothetical protein